MIWKTKELSDLDMCYFDVVHMECDKCHSRTDSLFWVEDEQWCANCTLTYFDKVDPETELGPIKYY